MRNIGKKIDESSDFSVGLVTLLCVLVVVIMIPPALILVGIYAGIKWLFFS